MNLPSCKISVPFALESDGKETNRASIVKVSMPQFSAENETLPWRTLSIHVQSEIKLCECGIETCVRCGMRVQVCFVLEMIMQTRLRYSRMGVSGNNVHKIDVCTVLLRKY